MKHLLLSATAFAGFVGIRRVPGDKPAPVASSSPRPQEFEDITRSFIMNVTPPGVAYRRHR